MASALNLDSLWGVWNDETQPDTNRLKAMFNISWYGYLFSQPDSAFYFAQMEYDFAESVNNKKSMASALNTQGVSFAIRGDYAKAIDYHGRSLKIREELGDKKGIAGSLNNIGNIYFKQGNYVKSLVHYNKSLKIYEEAGGINGISSCYSNIGNIYKEQGNHKKALDYYDKSLKIKQEIGDINGMSNLFGSIGLIYYEQSNYVQALEYHRKSLILKEKIGNRRGMAMLYSNILNATNPKALLCGSIDFSTIAKEFYSGTTIKENLVVTTQKDWEELWVKIYSIQVPQPKLPTVDFNKEVIIGVFGGEFSSGGYDIEIIETKKTTRTITIKVKTISPGNRCGVTSALSQPMHLVKIAIQKNKKFVFEESNHITNCAKKKPTP